MPETLDQMANESEVEIVLEKRSIFSEISSRKTTTCSTTLLKKELLKYEKNKTKPSVAMSGLFK
jgi:hypothetical protein